MNKDLPDFQICPSRFIRTRRWMAESWLYRTGPKELDESAGRIGGTSW